VKTLLICHEGAALEQHGLGRWLASFSSLGGIIVLRETRRRAWQRVRRERRRVGTVRFLDVLAFRAYYTLCLSRRDRRWEDRRLQAIEQRYPDVSLAAVPILYTSSPNTPEAEAFIRDVAPDMMIARCKTLLQERIFTIPTKGTFVMHPGICPEYRNSHGAFWALANDDLDRVGVTLLQIDKGVDTGPVYGYYRCRYDERGESHIRIQHRALHDNLDEVRQKLLEIDAAVAVPLDVTGRGSATWGQPWLSRYVRWKHQARKRSRRRAVTLLYHDVVNKGEADESGFPGPHAARYKLEADDFERHIAALSRVIASRPVTIDDALEVRKKAPPLMLTFDDGGVSASTVIERILDRYGWKAHFFVTTDYIGRPGFLTADQIRALRKHGHVIGTHSRSHPQRMSSLGWEALVREWRGSADALADILGEPVTVASIPGGCYSRRVAEAAAFSGFKALFTSEPRTAAPAVDGCVILGRYTIWRGMPPEVSAGLASWGRLRATQFLSWNSRKVAKVLGGEAYVKTLRYVLGVRG
jgi:peptidoglycan/xylan/chitin deacetylase (PgdA/CDA1 family)